MLNWVRMMSNRSAHAGVVSRDLAILQFEESLCLYDIELETSARQLRLGDFVTWSRAKGSDSGGDDIDTYVFSKFTPPLPTGGGVF